jgi:hypothetical protein
LSLDSPEVASVDQIEDRLAHRRSADIEAGGDLQLRRDGGADFPAAPRNLGHESLFQLLIERQTSIWSGQGFHAVLLRYKKLETTYIRLSG